MRLDMFYQRIYSAKRCLFCSRAGIAYFMLRLITNLILHDLLILKVSLVSKFIFTASYSTYNCELKHDSSKLKITH